MKASAEREVADIETFGVLFLDGFKISSHLALLYNLVFMIRIIFFNCVAFFMADTPIVQVQLYSLMSLVMLCYLLRVRPFAEKADNRREVANELGTFVISLQTYAFSGQLYDARTSYVFGWFIVASVFFVITMNIGLILY
jgi:hypothetical protein